MNLHEYQAKDLLRKYNLPILEGKSYIENVDDLEKDLPTVDELGAAGLIDSTNIDNAIFGTGKFYKEKQDDKKEDIYSNIDEMLSSTLDSEDNK